MADNVGSSLTGIFSGTGNVLMTIVIIVGICLLILLVFGGLFALYWYKKRYNLLAEIKMIRSDGKIVLGEWGKGLFNSKRGVLLIKRKKMKAVPIKIIDIKRYLQGLDLVTVIQLGPNDFRPVINDSWTEHIIEYVDEKTGELVKVKEAVLNIKVDTGDNKSWESAYQASSKKAFSISSILQMFQVPIAIAIVLISVFVGFAIIWTKIGSLCGR